MRVEHLIHLQIHADSDATDALFAPSKTLSTEVITNMQRMTAGTFNVAGGGAPENLALGDIGAVRAILLQADGDFNAVFNAGAQTFQFRRADTAAGRQAWCFMECNLTAVQITNPSATIALNGRYCCYGDPTA